MAGKQHGVTPKIKIRVGECLRLSEETEDTANSVSYLYLGYILDQSALMVSVSKYMHLKDTEFEAPMYPYLFKSSLPNPD